MSRRRQHLQVSTFPFLAVLLCTMGALILVLLSMDRKAKRAALHKAQDEAGAVARERQAEHDKLVASRRREHEAKKKSVRQAWEKKKDALAAQVSAEEQALSKELAAVQARLAEAARKIQQEEGSLEELRAQLDREKELLARQEQAVAAARRDARGAAQQITASDKARARLSTELRRLEKALADSASKQKKDGKTYSLIPYNGTRGEDRRPIYVECGHEGFVFHPQKKSLTSRDDLRAELKARLAEQQEQLKAVGAGDQKPYVMLLVRPEKEAIGRFYEMQSAARDLDVEFGYEFVEADWVLNFPKADAAVKPAVAATPAPNGNAARPAVRLATGVPVSSGSPLPLLGQDGRPLTDRQPVRLLPGGFGPGSALGNGNGPKGSSPDGKGDEEVMVSDLVSRGQGTAQTSAKPAAGGGELGTGTGNGTGIGGVGTGPGTGGGGIVGGTGNGGTGIGGGEIGEPKGGGSGTIGMGTGNRGGSGNGTGTGIGGVGTGPGTGGGGIVGGTGNGGTGIGGGEIGEPEGGGSGTIGMGTGNRGGSGNGTGTGIGGVGTGTTTGDGSGGAGAVGAGTGPSQGVGAVKLVPDASVLRGEGGKGGTGGGGTGVGGNGGGGTPGQSGGPPPLLAPGMQMPAASLASPSPNQGRAANASAIGEPMLLPPINGGSGSGSGTGSDTRTGSGTGTGSEGSGQPSSGQPGGNNGKAGMGRQQSGPEAKGGGSPTVGPSVPEPPDGKSKGPRLLRPARLSGDGESIIFVECKADVVIVHPTRRQVPVEKLNHNPAYNPLYQVVSQQMQSRQRLAKPGETVRVHVRFLVHPDGERTFHLAYPALDSLKLTMTRYTLQKWDDVNRIVSEY